MDRKTWIVVTLCIISLFAWNYWYTANYAPRPVPQGQEQPVMGDAVQPGDIPANPDQPAGSETAGASPVDGTAPAAAVNDRTAPTGMLEAEPPKINTPLAEYTFTKYGGGISSAVLHQHVTSDGKQVIMNEFATMPIGGITADPKPDSVVVYDVVEHTATKIVFEGDFQPGLRLRKTYEVPAVKEGDGDIGHLLHLKLDWINTSGAKVKSPDFYVQLGEEEAIYESDPSLYTTIQWQSNKGQAQKHVDWFKASNFLWLFPMGSEKESFSQTFEWVSWAGVTNQFFCVLVTAADQDHRGTEVWASRTAEKRAQQHGKTIYAIHGAMRMPGLSLDPAATSSQNFRIYTGPKEYNRLKELPDNEDGILNFGFFSPISVFLLNMMNFFEKYLHSYALAIVAITIVLKIVLWPLQTKSMRSMKRMSDNMKLLQPKLDTLKAKYKDNPQRLNEETMKLYKEHNINPMGGCLPSLAQFPIFLGFFYMLRTAVELRNSSFLWVEDLSRPDTVYTLLGLVPINPLPLIMTASMVVYMRLQPTTGNDMQKKMMMLMPLMFLAFCYNFASALALYWTAQNLLSIVQFYLTKDIREGKSATVAATVGGKPAIVEPPPKTTPAKKKGAGKRR